jgi:uncharacterized protein (DUF305 family)
MILTAAVVATVAGGVLGGCGSDPDGVNEADTRFATHQVAHHAQTVHLLNLSLGRDAVSREASVLSDDTRARHLTEIGTLSRWLRSHDVPVPDTGLAHADEGEAVEFDTSVPGVLAADEVDAVQDSGAATFEDAWLDALVKHERGAVRIAEAEIEDGHNAAMVAFAEKDRTAHARRLARLRGLAGS